LPFPARFGPESSPETGKTLPRFRPKTVFALRGLLLFCLYIGLSFKCLAQQPPTEYQIKAAFLFNFAKFVEWPAEAFSDSNAPIVIGVLGKNVFGTDLENTIRDKKVNNRIFKFKNFTSASEATNCQILFVSSSEKDNFSKIVAGMHNTSILTVSETDGFIQAGGMVNFLIQDSKIRFQISDEAAKKAGLKVSSKLLSLAVPGH
jgi:YfiR/HmsC-like